MSCTKKRIGRNGSAAVEMIYAILIFLAFLAVVRRFSFLASESHHLSVKLQNDVEQMMVRAGRPACLEKLGDGYIKDEAPRNVFGDKPLMKRLVFVKTPICGGG